MLINRPIKRHKPPAERPGVDIQLQRYGEEALIYAAYSRGHAKIGCTTELLARIGQLQAGNPFPIVLLTAWAVDGSRAAKAEQDAHRALNGSHVSGEWFHCSRADARLAVENAAKSHGGKPYSRSNMKARRIRTPLGEFRGLGAARERHHISRQAIWSKCTRKVPGWSFIDDEDEPFTPNWLSWNVEEAAE